ncbi:MAG: hypothetical protein KDC38_20380, partial [Planctomycetes bacterium]|nr:hypothetical protein [Planctomycetota bacterium]
MVRAQFLVACLGICFATALASPALAEDGDPRFYRAYYLETEEGRAEAAAELYRLVIDDPSVSVELRSEATLRWEGCREEIASADLARLLRPETIAYLELTRPGDQLTELASQLGLLRGDGGSAFGLSPALLDGVLGIRGIAIGINGFDAMRGAPRGILVAHPGDVDVVRGLIETALPVAAAPADPIHGCATYVVEEDFPVFITLTRRLVLVSPQRSTIERTVERLRGEVGPSLADEPDMHDSLARREEGLFYFGVNLHRLMPMVQPLIQLEANRDPELRLLLATADLESLRSVSGHLRVGESGLQLDVELQLAEGHRNLIYDLFRMPSIDPETLAGVPRGAAGFVTAALNPRRPAMESPSSQRTAISWMDFGREVFGNIVGVAAFGIEVDGETLAGAPAPGLALVMTVNDPERTEALWTQLLGVVSCAEKRGASIEGERIEVAGREVRVYPMPEGITMHFARRDRTFVVSP